MGILGNHYSSAYDYIWDIDKFMSKINTEKDLQIGTHVDTVFSRFIATFQDDVFPFDFRLTNILAMSTSSHKFGESV